MHLKLTLRLQSIGFCIGSSFFALGAIPPVATAIGSTWTNVLFFVGSWFFTGAAFIQLQLAGPKLVPYQGHKLTPNRNEITISAAWLAAATQFVGTILFNISTGEAIVAHTVHAEQYKVWAPNAAGSTAFLISAFFVMVTLLHTDELWRLLYRTTLSGWINLVGCVAFGVSAWAAFVFRSGSVKNAYLANLGTFVGAVCFFLASIFFVGRAGENPPDDGESAVATAPTVGE